MKAVNWFKYNNSNKLEEQVKYHIAGAVEGYLNGIYDNCGYEPMTRQSWVEYVQAVMKEDYNWMINGKEFKHLNFYGAEKTMSLINYYLDNYQDIKQYIVKQ